MGTVVAGRSAVELPIRLVPQSYALDLISRHLGDYVSTGSVPRRSEPGMPAPPVPVAGEALAPQLGDGQAHEAGIEPGQGHRSYCSGRARLGCTSSSARIWAQRPRCDASIGPRTAPGVASCARCQSDVRRIRRCTSPVGPIRVRKPTAITLSVAAMIAHQRPGQSPVRAGLLGAWLGASSGGASGIGGHAGCNCSFWRFEASGGCQPPVLPGHRSKTGG